MVESLRPSHQRDLVEAQFERVLSERVRWRDAKLDGTDLYVTMNDPWTSRKYRGHFDLARFDLEAPKFQVVDPHTLRPLARRFWPRPFQVRGPPLGGRKFTHETLHPETGESWVCVEGTWHFHAHYHHQDVPWDSIRNVYTLYRVLENLAAGLYGSRAGGVGA